MAEGGKQEAAPLQAVFEEDDRRAVLVALFEAGPVDNITITIGHQELSLIRQILALKAPMLLAVLDAKMAADDKQHNAVAIDDPQISFSVMMAMANFLYTGVIHFKGVPMAFDVLYVAKQFTVSKLLGFARVYIASMLTLDNVLDVLELADRHDEPELEESALELASKHKKAIIKSKRYQEFRKNQTAKDKLLEYIMMTTE